jgi:uncharacterized protein YuzE
MWGWGSVGESITVHYDRNVDALSISFGDETPDGAVEVDAGINVDTTKSGRITGIEILSASKKTNINTILTYSIDLPRDLKDRAS